jgi:hypothetical protein
MGFPKHTWGTVYKKPAFEILPGEPAEESLSNPHYVSNGFLFNTFSFDYSSSIPVHGLFETFSLRPNHKIYIEIDLDVNLQPFYARIKCTTVNDSNWKYYPFPALIEPELTSEEREDAENFPWANGRILKLPPNRRQTKLYILIGYRADDSNKNGNADTTSTNNSQQNNSSPVQILRENVILLGSMVDFAPGLIAIPYFYGGLTHIQSLVTSTEKTIVTPFGLPFIED